jgi:ribonuclease HI
MEVIMYTDGACSGNPGPGGWATILLYKNYRKEISGGFKLTTNARMEIKAVIEGLRQLKFPVSVIIYSDSSYVVNTINKWINTWIKNDFSKKKNVDLWKEYVKVASNHKVRAIWIKSHDGNPENERCDELAVQNISSNQPDDEGYV